MKTNPNGMIIWAGPSALDGAPIVVVATGLSGASGNRKTGDMIQTWILSADTDPVAAVKSGADATVCGTCVHRGFNAVGARQTRTCYVNIGQAPLSVYRAYRRGSYGAYDPIRLRDAARGRGIRLGAYGDPAAVPFHVWDSLMRDANPAYHTGYTHQWRTCDPRFSRYCMASADVPADVPDAEAKGYRAFLVTEERVAGTTRCPSDPALPVHVPCNVCRRCDGRNSGNAHSVRIAPHGPAARHYRVKLATI